MNDPNKKFEKVEKLISIFKPERFTYMAISGISCFALLAIVVYSIFFTEEPNLTQIISLFLPAGAITFSMGRIMKMWNDVVKILFNITIESDSGE